MANPFQARVRRAIAFNFSLLSTYGTTVMFFFIYLYLLRILFFLLQGMFSSCWCQTPWYGSKQFQGKNVYVKGVYVS